MSSNRAARCPTCRNSQRNDYGAQFGPCLDSWHDAPPETAHDAADDKEVMRADSRNDMLMRDLPIQNPSATAALGVSRGGEPLTAEVERRIVEAVGRHGYCNQDIAKARKAQAASIAIAVQMIEREREMDGVIIQELGIVAADAKKRAEAAEKKMRIYGIAIEQYQGERDEARKALVESEHERAELGREVERLEKALVEARGKYGHVAGCHCRSIQRLDDQNVRDPRCAPERGGEE